MGVLPGTSRQISILRTHILPGVRNPTPLKQAVAQMSPIPIFLIAAEGEKITSQVYYDEAKGPKELWLRNEAGHQIDALFDQPEEYEQRVISFIDQYLLAGD